MEGTKKLRLGASPPPYPKLPPWIALWTGMSCPVPSVLSSMSWSFPFCFPRTQGWGGAPCLLPHPTNSLGTDFLTLQDLDLAICSLLSCCLVKA